jgi:hypothetical protein
MFAGISAIEVSKLVLFCILRLEHTLFGSDS